MRILETERLILRSWDLGDVKDLYEYAQSELVGPNAGWKPHKSIEESQEIIKMFIGNNDVYAVELKSENKVIGSIGIHRRYVDDELCELKQRELGYVLNPKYWGNGYIPEALKYIIEYCFKELKVDVIWCGHFENNNNSKRVNEKCGFNYQFSKQEILESMNYKKVTTLYYKLCRNSYKNRRIYNGVKPG